ncbi:PEP-CTERM sorting domain-containing protein [Nostoc sp. UCD121]|uniref:PEP-CTERM sorting domain-containing protein n=1 Tax=unclassified Nostoc TaxID=2593658 RepID=UPI001624B72F|nr:MULTISPECIES: PEP-CTERM sorting domain-containing protein [unclassified Nostoc]MBC1222197.1 PEP-CTERM sorting domain-containing protein [Nostoc sp. UCD120]MBC1274456.1 PEP-CTERM sorting domain-containing protein [Nostoc sp. UCD121]MBC1295731.1 PEP-CTERM sorting domain-containing protein [Nostoc sp. UCD122]
MKATTIISLFLTGIGATVIATSAPASATTFGFNNITGGDTVGDAFAPNFSFNVTDYGSGKVLFKFLNNASSEQALKQVAFSVDSSVSGILSNIAVNVGNSGTVDFELSSQNLSQSNNISGWDGTTFGADTKGGNGNAVQSRESLGITFTGNYNAVLAAINAGTLQVGIHVGSLPRGASDSYVSTPPSQSVPEPSTLFGVGLVFGLASLSKANNGKKWKQKQFNA